MKLLTKLLLSCKQATEFVERHKDGELSRIQRAQLGMHLLICRTCRAYNKQSQQIHTMLTKHLQSNSKNPQATETQALKIRILSRLAQK